MNLLRGFMVLEINGGIRVSYTYDKIDPETGEPISTNNSGTFYVVDQALAESIDAVRSYIMQKKLAE